MALRGISAVSLSCAFVGRGSCTYVRPGLLHVGRVCACSTPPRGDESRGSRGASKHGCVGQGYGVLKPFLLLRYGAAVHWLESQPTVARPSRATRDKGIVMAGVLCGRACMWTCFRCARECKKLSFPLYRARGKMSATAGAPQPLVRDTHTATTQCL